MQGTDYSKYIVDISERLTIPILEEILQDRYYKEFKYIRSNAFEPLATFLDYISYIINIKKV